MIELLVEESLVKPSIAGNFKKTAALLHSIVFHRNFALVEPVERRIDALGITFVKAVDPNLDDLIQEKLSLIKSDAFVVKIKFYPEQKQERAWFPLMRKDPECWEEWTISCKSIQSTSESGIIELIVELDVLMLDSKTSLLNALKQIAQKSLENYNLVPPISSTIDYPFPFKITIAN